MIKKRWLSILALSLTAVSCCALGSCEALNKLTGNKSSSEKTAYEIWLENGNSGTEEDFMAWLSGQGSQSSSTETPDPTPANDSLSFEKIEGKEEYCVIGKGTDTSDHIIIPDTYQGLPVTEIGKKAFLEEKTIKKVTISAKIKKIDNDAFKNCEGLVGVYSAGLEAWLNIEFGNPEANPVNYAKKLYIKNQAVCDLVIPSTITEIKEHTFQNCDSITSVVIPETVTKVGNGAFYKCDELKTATVNGEIGKSVFSNCTSLESVTLEDTVTSISDYAFNHCSNLKSIKLGNTLTNIGNNAFYFCTKLESVVIPDSVKTIGEYAFRYCEALKTCKIGNGVTEIGEYAFTSCKSLQKIDIPDSVKTIGDFAFYECETATKIKIGNGVTSLGLLVFDTCKSVKEFIIGDGITEEINFTFFYGINDLEVIVFGSSVQGIDYYTLLSQEKLKKVYYKGTESAWNKIYNDPYDKGVGSAQLYFYSETSKSGCWHFDKNGNISLW